MDHIFSVEIVTPLKAIRQAEIVSIVVPAESGYLGVLANHAPLITNLVPGKIFLRDSGNKRTTFYSSGKGFLHVLKNSVTLILDSINES